MSVYAAVWRVYKKAEELIDRLACATINGMAKVWNELHKEGS